MSFRAPAACRPLVAERRLPEGGTDARGCGAAKAGIGRVISVLAASVVNAASPACCRPGAGTGARASLYVVRVPPLSQSGPAHEELTLRVFWMPGYM